MNQSSITRSVSILLAAVFLAGCSTTGYKEKADAEAYSLIAEKRGQVPGMTADISIEPREAPDFADLPMSDLSYDYLGDAKDSEIGMYVLSLNGALDLAIKHSRSYQSQKESLYRQALQLSEQRHVYDPIFSGSVSSDIRWSTRDEVLTGVNNLTHVDITSLTSGSVATGLGVSKMMKGGGRMAVSLTSNFFEFLSGRGTGDSATSVLLGTFTQPLLQGRGRKIAMENLTQSERNLLYSLRDFTRFRKEFSVQITAEYYNVLRNKDSVNNNYLSYQSFQTSLEREKAFQAEGLKTPGQVARLEQSTLSSESSWTRSINTYQASLDRFKISLGIKTDTPLVLNDIELEQLATGELLTPGLELAEAVELALVTRLDLYTQIDEILDAERKIVIAANGMQPRMDLLISGRYNSKDGNRVSALDFQRHDYTVGVDLELPFDRKSDRNNYRNSLINLEVARRSADALVDNVKLDVRNGWRDLGQANRDYDISVLSVDINTKRLEEEKLKEELGEGNILDLIDAQNALTNAQTAFTGSLVQQRITLLEFWRDVGVLYVHDNGQWENRTNG